MSVDYQSFAEFASKLLSSESEIDWRMSAGRAYYASYHRALLSTQYCPENSHLAMGSHERVSDQFIKHGTTSARSIAYILQSMKRLRHIADYNLQNKFDRGNATSQLAQHKLMVQKLDQFDSQAISKTA
jgi:uncharacterized protein (UPF0332 family)